MPLQTANLAQVYRQYVHLVRGQLRRFTRDEPTVEALTEEVFVRFWRRHGGGLGTASQMGEILWRLAMQSAGHMARGRRRPNTRWRRFLARPSVSASAPDVPPALPADCLGNLAVALVAAQERLPSAAEMQHLQSCAACQRRLRSERAAVSQAAVLPLPADLLALCPVPPRHSSPRVGWRAWLSVLAMLAASVASAAMIPRRGPEEPGLQAYAPGQVTAVARRADGTQRRLALVPDGGPTLQAGEELRVHVAWPEPTAVRLRRVRDGAILYAGRLPADGWLPTRLSGEGIVPPPLEVILCPLEGETECWTRPLP